MYVFRLIHMQKAREKKKTIHNDRENYEVGEFVFDKSLPHFTLDSFLKSRLNLFLFVEPLNALSSEMVQSSQSLLEKNLLLLTFASILIFIPFPQNHATNTLIHVKVKMGDGFHREHIFE